MSSHIPNSCLYMLKTGGTLIRSKTLWVLCGEIYSNLEFL